MTHAVCLSKNFEGSVPLILRKAFFIAKSAIYTN